MLPGQKECGDVSSILWTEEGMLTAVVDGLGHGDEAAQASRLVLRMLEQHRQEHIISLVQHCHQALRGTRGAVLSLASFNLRDRVMTWLGVGNVEGVLIRADGKSPSEALLLRSGVLGSVLPPLQAAVLPVTTGDLLILATDGIRTGFESSMIRSAPPQSVADHILQQYGKPADDALVLVARFAVVDL
jgi:serine phosphatase RsbU (regulator of sigma subunit)